jgi:hypothetical protein
MRKILKTLLLLSNFLIGSQTNLVAQVCPQKLPIPDKNFLKNVWNSDDAEIKYFKKYIGKTSEPKVLKTFSETKESCKTIHNFKNGIIYQKDICSESGADVIIYFPGYCKAELIKYVEWFFKSERNVWNKEKTIYQPKEEGYAGCYIEIKQYKKGYFIEYYCGC